MEKKNQWREILRGVLYRIKSERDDYKGLYLRALADFKNYKQKQVREFQTIRDSCKEEIMLKILPILDNFERALSTPNSELSENADAFKKGVEMIYKAFKSTLQQEGVEEMDVIGKDFDPSCHEALERVESENHKDNIIIDCIEKGYFINGKLLRPARVIVAKSPEKTQKS